MIFFFFKQKTAYEMRISDWSSDVCSSDLENGSPQTNRLLRRYKDATFIVEFRQLSSPIELRVSARLPVALGIGRFDGSNESRKAISSRSEERRVGKECVSTCRSRGSPYH